MKLCQICDFLQIYNGLLSYDGMLSQIYDFFLTNLQFLQIDHKERKTTISLHFKNHQSFFIVEI